MERIRIRDKQELKRFCKFGYKSPEIIIFLMYPDNISLKHYNEIFEQLVKDALYVPAMGTIALFEENKYIDEWCRNSLTLGFDELNKKCISNSA